MLSAGVFTTINFPGAQQTQPYRINDNGQIVGRYLSNGDYHVFRRIDGNFTAVDDVPWAVQTVPGISHLGGLNSSGDIVGIYSSVTFQNFAKAKAVDGLRGFLLSAGLYTPIDFPDAVVTLAFGINDDGIVVGTYQNADGTIHGFLRAP
jgi:probable HAF family extracellular repeat protein